MVAGLAAALWLLAAPPPEAGDAIHFDAARALKNRQRDEYVYALDSCLRGRAVYLVHAGATSRRAAAAEAGAFCRRGFVAAVVQRGLMTQRQAHGLVADLARQAIDAAANSGR